MPGQYELVIPEKINGINRSFATEESIGIYMKG
jgi:hypothetical protein